MFWNVVGRIDVPWLVDYSMVLHINGDFWKAQYKLQTYVSKSKEPMLEELAFDQCK